MNNLVDILQTISVMGYELNIYGTKENPLFLAVEVGRMIDYSNGNTGQMLDTVDPDEKLTLTLQRSGQKRLMWFLTEYGFYEVLMQSRKPIARRFKTAVKNILHDLRMNDQGDFEDWLNQSDPLVDEWEREYRFREENGDEELTFEDFLRTKGFTDDMLS